MSLYNTLHGKNPLSIIILKVLGLDDSTEKVGRFRDIWISKDRNEIILYTRNGGGNRECWEYEGCVDIGNVDDPLKHDPKCLVRVNYELTKHPLYLRDFDDEYDCTYASFVFKMPDKFKELLTTLAAIEPRMTNDKSLREKTQNVLDKIETMSVEEIKANYPTLDAIMNKIKEMFKD